MDVDSKMDKKKKVRNRWLNVEARSREMAVQGGSVLRSRSNELTYRTCECKLGRETVHVSLKRVSQKAGEAPFSRCLVGTKGVVVRGV